MKINFHNPNLTAEDKQMIVHAYKHLQYQHSAATRRILFPEQATIEYPDFQPCRATQTIAIVRIPGIYNSKEMTFTYPIVDGESISN